MITSLDEMEAKWIECGFAVVEPHLIQSTSFLSNRSTVIGNSSFYLQDLHLERPIRMASGFDFSPVKLKGFTPLERMGDALQLSSINITRYVVSIHTEPAPENESFVTMLYFWNGVLMPAHTFYRELQNSIEGRWYYSTTSGRLYLEEDEDFVILNLAQ